VKLYITIIAIILFAACNSFKISRVGYQNLRKNADTTCKVTIAYPEESIKNEDVLGRLTLKSKPFQKKSSKTDAFVLIKQEACAINANKVVIVEESFNGKDSSKSYSCIVDLCREVNKKPSIPDFVNRARSEVEIAKKQRKKMEEKGKIDIDTATTKKDTVSYQFDDSWMTDLKEYRSKDSAENLIKTDSVIDIVAENIDIDFLQEDTVVYTETIRKQKLAKGMFANVGYGYGGTSYAGLELEYAVDRFGLFGGAGVFGYNYGIAIHIKRDPISSYLSIMYQNVGLVEFYKYSIAGIAFNYRGKRWLTARAGVGKVIKLADEEPDKDYAPILSIGAYVPL